MELRTFNEWSQMGYKIIKGSKTRGKTLAGFMFSREQVQYIGSRYRGQRYAHDSRTPWEDYDSDPWFDDAYNATWGG
jgi:hypothetical protein